MTTQDIRAELRFLISGKQYEISALRMQHQKLEARAEDGDLVVLAPDDFRRDVSSGRIQLLAISSDGLHHPVLTDWLNKESASEKEERNRRAQILSFVARKRAEGVPFSSLNSELIAFCEQNRFGRAPSERTLRTWRNLALNHESSLPPGWSRCGNRKQGPDEILIGIFHEVFNVMLAGADKCTLSSAWQTTKALYDSKWKQRNGALTEPPKHSIRKLRAYFSFNALGGVTQNSP